MEIHLPVDFERRLEFRTLAQRLKAHGDDSIPVLAYMRLMVELAYSANLHSRPGFLPEQAARLYVSGLTETSTTHPDLDNILVALEDSRVLRREEGGYFCEHFAAWNKHLVTDHVSWSVANQRRSLVKRRSKAIETLASQQALLIPSERMRRRDGTALDADSANAVMVLIHTLDSCLERPQRKPAELTEGMVADAAEMIEAKTGKQRDEFARWLAVNREHAAVPRTTEQILARWQSVWEMQRSQG